MKRFLIGFAILVTTGPLAAECLTVTHKAIDPQSADAGASQVFWEVEIENSCEVSHDALLSVQFTSEEGEVVYEVPGQARVGRLGSKRLEKKVYIPSRYIDRIHGIEIELEERERPI
ncbi:MAG: hypothetical protein ACQETD_11635 [Pseudomonadota bacterium]